MEPTEAAEAAVWRVLDERKMDVAEREVVFDAVRAAFAAVPDPTTLADKWDKDDGGFFEPDWYYGVSHCADELRSFMRGDNK